jgi:hypothetical protein
MNILRALHQVGTVELIVLNREEVTVPVGSELDCQYKVSYSVDVKCYPNRGMLKKLRWTLDPRMSYPNGCRVSDEASRKVRYSLAASDIVWFFKLSSPDMFPSAAWRRSVVDIDDVPSTYERAKLQVTDNLRDSLLARRNVFAWERREKLLGRRFTVLSVCSHEDKQYLEKTGARAAIHVIPNGYNAPWIYCII